MGMFIKLEDSPMFQKQVVFLEEKADELKDRCQKLYSGCKKYMTSIGEASNVDTLFADTLETFGGGVDDPVSVSIGGPVISRFITAFRELASYKELLRSQVEHVLIDRLSDFMEKDLKDVKESRRRFDKAGNAYDQVRTKFVSLKKNTRDDVVTEVEEDLQNSRSEFERSRFNLVNSLMNVEAKKKYEFLESISALMDAHLRYFKLGHDLFSQMEPYIHQVLTYAQQSREQAAIEQDKLAKRIQEFRTQAEMDSIQRPPAAEPPASSSRPPVIGMSTYKDIEAIMQSSANGEVRTIKQGYLLKRSSSSRGDWKRRFFVLDSQGTLYYYSNRDSRPMGAQSFLPTGSDQNNRVFGRFRARHRKAASLSEENLECRFIDLHASTIKLDVEDTDLRLCFRIISPLRTYTLQAENGADRMDWIRKIKGAITSLLNTHFLQQPHSGVKLSVKANPASSSAVDLRLLDKNDSSEDHLQINRTSNVAKLLREIPGNEVCAECSAPEPDWASLNLGILLCIECSGVHRNLGVHISKVRSLSLDVKVWEPTIMELFQKLGNSFCNSIWEGLFLHKARGKDVDAIIESVTKPCSRDSFHQKERFIQAKYAEKLLVLREAKTDGTSDATNIWQAVQMNNVREVYRLIAVSDSNIVNTTSNDVVGVDVNHHVGPHEHSAEGKPFDPTACPRIKDSKESGNCLQGCSLLHLACNVGDPVMIELLLQFGADINMRDFHGRTPLHHCISLRRNDLAKFLLRRGARPSIDDGGGLTALERAMEMGAIADEELFILLADN